MNLVFMTYNNYYNRIVKKFDTIAEYDSYIGTGGNIQEYYDVQFNPNDGISTEQIVNWGNNKWSPDYLVVYDDTLAANINIQSRWFVIEWIRTRGGQYKAILKRDVLADFKEVVWNAPIFLEKGYIEDTTSPLLYNREGMAVNQIKQSETLLKDETGCGWVVGYVPYDAFSSATTITKDVPVSATANITVAGISNWAYWKNVNTNPSYKYMGTASGDAIVNLKLKNNYASSSRRTWYGYTASFKLDGNNCVATENRNENSNTEPTWYTNWCTPTYFEAMTGTSQSARLSTAGVSAITANIRNNATFKGYVNALLGTDTIEINTQSAIDSLLALDGQIIKDSTSGSYYKIKIVTVSTSSPVNATTGTTAGTNVINFVNNNIVRTGYGVQKYVTGNFGNNEISVAVDANIYAIELDQIFVAATVDIDSTRLHLEDSPYDMFCIPYSDTLKLYDGTDEFTCSKGVAVSIACAIGAESGSGNVYDIQLLPYCPARALVAASSNPSAKIDMSGGSYDLIKAAGTSTKIGAIIWCDHSSFSVNIDSSINPVLDTPEDIKVANECDLYRLCSGNYNGMFEFSPAKSRGLDGFIAECTYKPFTPYIHILPKLKGLYGDNFVSIDDARGLVCGGDFSLPQTTSVWANYELSNKNYQAVFDRQLQNMDVNNSIARQEAIWQLTAGSVSGTAGGAAAGAMVGGIPGAIVGAVGGAAASTFGGIMDYSNLTKRQEEARQYSIDMYNYQLQNIQAIPQSLAKSSALTYNTRFWPFVEYFTCTPTEKDIFKNKIKYNGMTVMAITTLNDFVAGTGHFYKGQIIRLEGLEEDSHIAYVIYEELNKGVYI